MPPNTQINASVRILPNGHKHNLRVQPTDTIGEVAREGAAAASIALLPPTGIPLDRVYLLDEHPPAQKLISDLTQPIGDLPGPHGQPKDLGVELMRVIRVNADWRIAPADSMTPRQILTLFGLNPDQFSLYAPMQTTPLPPDTAVPTTRGKEFEAQKDGNYGGGGNV